MSELTQIIKLLRDQMEMSETRHQKQMETQLYQMQSVLMKLQENQAKVSSHLTSYSFPAFEPNNETWKDYWARFNTYRKANTIAPERRALVFLTNQSKEIYQLIATEASQWNPAKDINSLSIDEINEIMSKQFDPKKFVTRERFKFYTEMKRLPDESPQELAARIRSKAAMCDFPSIDDPLDEAMKTSYICAINNEAVLRVIFKKSTESLRFSDVVNIATEVEEATKTAKAQMGNEDGEIHKVYSKEKITPRNYPLSKTKKKHGEFNPRKAKPNNPSFRECATCGKTNHAREDCRRKNAACNYCGKIGHIEDVCYAKRRNKVKTVTQNTQKVRNIMKKLSVLLEISNIPMKFEVDTGSLDNFISETRWIRMGKPKLTPTSFSYKSATEHSIPTKGRFTSQVRTKSDTKTIDIDFMVTPLKDMNIIGLRTLKENRISVDDLIFGGNCTDSLTLSNVNSISNEKAILKKKCDELCKKFYNLWKPELGCLKGIKLKIKFKENAKPIFFKARTVPFALQEDLNIAYEKGISKGIWEITDFNEYGTPTVPVKKKSGEIRVCGDYSITVNPQLENHRFPLPLPDELIQKLAGGYFFSKVDLADAYNQIQLDIESQKRLALSTHKGVLLQKRLPFGIKSAPSYFQEIMAKLTTDLKGVVVYLDDILVSGVDAEDHLNNLEKLLQRLEDKGLRCKLEKCSFAQEKVTYLGHTISTNGISHGPNANDILDIGTPKNVHEVRSFLGSVQFYSKFIKNLSSIADPLYALTRKDTAWKWSKNEEDAFRRLKSELNSERVLAHFDPTQEIGISCDASSIGIGAVLFHRYKDGAERPILNASKTLTSTQRKYPQIQKEALSIIFALKKYYQYLYGRRFILVTDHKPLLTILGPNKATPPLAANRLARWALTLAQYDYTIEYRATNQHGNADALSRLPSGPDSKFDAEEAFEDNDVVCVIKNVNALVKKRAKTSIKKLSDQDPVISTAIRYTNEGWPSSVPENLKRLKLLEHSLSVINGCLLYGSRIVIPEKMQAEVLKMLHQGHFGIVRMKQLARSAVYWMKIDKDIESLAKNCDTCGENQRKPQKSTIHPWILPEKPWSRVHIDHAINFKGLNWLIIIDAYSKYPCIHATSSITTKSTIEFLEEDFAHFGYPHTIVSDNATSFMSEEFETWCKEKGILHLTGAPYYPSSNGSAERLVQTFKQSLRKSLLKSKQALQEFLKIYRRTPLSCGLSPSQLLNGRQIRIEIDALLPNQNTILQSLQQSKYQKINLPYEKTKLIQFKPGRPCYTLKFMNKHNSTKWIPGWIIKPIGNKLYEIKLEETNKIVRRHLRQLRERQVQNKNNIQTDKNSPEDYSNHSFEEPDDERTQIEETSTVGTHPLDQNEHITATQIPQEFEVSQPSEVQEPTIRHSLRNRNPNDKCLICQRISSI